jgi:AcrR family transcriptional regulator
VQGAAVTRTPGTREAVLREAARLFAERGFRGTSVEEIGAACGISGPAVYKHFASKHALLARLLVGISEQLLAGGQAVVAGAGDDPQAALDALVEAHADFATGDPDLIRIQDRDLASLAEIDRRQVRRLQRAYVELWADVLCRVEPGLPLPVARLRAHAVFGLLNSTPYSAAGRGEARRQLVLMARGALAAGVALDTSVSRR